MTVRLKIALTIFVTGAAHRAGRDRGGAARVPALRARDHLPPRRRLPRRVVTASTTTCSTMQRAPAGRVQRLPAQPGAVRARHPALPARRAGHGAGHAPARRSCRRASRSRWRRCCEAAGERTPMPYVMGDDPERMDDDAVIAARPVRRAVIRNDEPVAGYLYLVCHKRALPEARWDGAAQQPGAAGAGADLRRGGADHAAGRAGSSRR